jgi:hypothetical protein
LEVFFGFMEGGSEDIAVVVESAGVRDVGLLFYNGFVK